MTDNLIIYPNFGQRISTWNINSACGKYEIPLMDTTDSESVILYVLTEDNQINNIEYNYVHSKQLFSIGMKVAISDDINKYGKHVSGIISKINQESVDVIATVDGHDRTYRINDYKIISAYGKSNQPDKLLVNITPVNKGKLKLSYLFANIGWSAHYKIIISDNMLKAFTLAATIIDNNSEDLSGDITLVAGEIKRPAETSNRGMVMAVSQKKETNYDKFDEYYKYKIGFKELTDKNRVDLLTRTDIVSDKYYVHDVSTGNYVSYGYKFEAPTFLPDGKIYLYSQDNNDLIYKGTSHLTEHREGDKVNIDIGKTTQIQAESNVSLVDRKIKSDETETYERDISIETKVKNTTNKDCLFIQKYRIGNDKIIKSNVDITRRKDGYLEWDFMLNPGQNHIKISLITSN